MNKTNLIILIILALFVTCCQKAAEEQQTATLAGAIINPEAEYVSVSYGYLEPKADTAILDEDGNFRLQLPMSDASYVTFKHDNERTLMFLSPEDSTYMTANMEFFDESLKFSGDKSIENNYLVEFNLYREKNLMNWKELFVHEYDVFAGKLDSLTQSYLDFLTKYREKQPEMSEKFKDYERNAITSEMMKFLIEYPDRYEYLHDTSGIDPGQDYETRIDQFDFDNPEFLTVPEYRSVVVKYLDHSVFEQYEDYEAEGYIAVIEDRLQNAEVKKFALYDQIMAFFDHMEINGVDTLIAYFSENYEDKELMQQFDERNKEIDHLKKGNPAPAFDATDMEGKEYSLKDFRGKYVYVDVWATWCGPCREEIPLLKELHEKFKDRNIEIISISIDKDKDAWEKMVKEEGLTGLQLYEQREEGDILEGYHIKYIPRFILIDTEGMIINANAKRPTENVETILMDLENI